MSKKIVFDIGNFLYEKFAVMQQNVIPLSKIPEKSSSKVVDQKYFFTVYFLLLFVNLL